MKVGILAVAAAMALSVNARKHNARRHNHQALHAERDLVLTTGSAPEVTCGCTTIYYTVTSEATLYFPPASSTSTSAPPPPPSTTAKPSPTSSPAPVVPTAFVTTCPTPGVYTIPATTITLTSETTVYGATSTSVPAGTHTAGGVTTIVETSTTVVCPYATTGTSAGIVTSTILTTTYVCPSAGTYTIAPLTTTVTASTVWVYPTPASFPAGTYTQDVVTVTATETDYVFFCPFTSPAPVPAPAPTSSAAPPPPAAATTSATPAPTSSSAAPSSSSSNSDSSSSSSSSIGQLGNPSGNQWAITYTPYDQSGHCKTSDAVKDDISNIASKGFSVVRVYSTDCSALDFIGAACDDNKIKMIIGVFLEKDKGIPGGQEQVDAIVAWARWDLVELAVIGNEAISSKAVTVGDLTAFISSSKQAFRNAGYNGPCTTTEPLDTWQANVGSWCDIVDVVGVNLHPFFNPDTVATDAGTFTAGQLSIADNLCPGKTAVNLETGWPSGGSCNNMACPGSTNQAIAVKAIVDEVGHRSVMFSYVDDTWKEPGDFECEQTWGLIHLFPLTS